MAAVTPRLDPTTEAEVKADARRAGRRRLRLAAPILAGLLARGDPDTASTLDHALSLAERLTNRNADRTRDDIRLALELEEARLARDPRRAA